jgi:4-alpha-glucanotransferase
LFAGNTLLISPELLVQDGLLAQLPAPAQKLNISAVDFDAATAAKGAMIDEACGVFEKTGALKKEFEEFCAENLNWLKDYALFAAAKKDQQNAPWNSWPQPLRDRNPEALKAAEGKFRREIVREKFAQFLFFRQWSTLRKICGELGISLIGDLPIYPAYDSCDVWVNRSLFKLDSEGMPLVVSGVPPDAFNAEGQWWGTPVYDWACLEAESFGWWISRIGHQLKLFDFLRFDHFRGLVAYWEIPADAPSAAVGRWVDAPAEKFLGALKARFPALPLIAEDLGSFDPRVPVMMERFGLPGMNVLVFAFDGNEENPYLPDRHKPNSVVYTSVHDTDTARGWFSNADAEVKRRLFDCLGHSCDEAGVGQAMIGLAMASQARLAMIPAQDVLSLGSQARMNRPGFPLGNWTWQILPEELSSGDFELLRRATIAAGRRS